jgi:hypothetical protein
MQVAAVQNQVNGNGQVVGQVYTVAPAAAQGGLVAAVAPVGSR